MNSQSFDMRWTNCSRNRFHYNASLHVLFFSLSKTESFQSENNMQMKQLFRLKIRILLGFDDVDVTRVFRSARVQYFNNTNRSNRLLRREKWLRLFIVKFVFSNDLIDQNRRQISNSFWCIHTSVDHLRLFQCKKIQYDISHQN